MTENSKNTAEIFRAMEEFARQLYIWEGEELLDVVFARFLDHMDGEMKSQLLMQFHFAEMAENETFDGLTARVAETFGPDHAGALREFAEAVHKLA